MGAQRLGDYGKDEFVLNIFFPHISLSYSPPPPQHYTIFSVRVFPECGETSLYEGPGSLCFVFFFNHCIYKVPHSMLLFPYKNPALYNLVKHSNKSTADASL